MHQFIFLQLLLLLLFCGAPGQIIAPGTSLTASSNRFWSSSSGEFGLGFFKLQGTPANTNYVGIVYVNVLEKTTSSSPNTVWIANRNRPAGDNSTLQITTSGLVLVDSGETIWQSSASINETTAVSGAEMLNGGNFVLYSGNSTVIWQTFDTPTHTLLPGQKLTTLSQALSSWRTTDDPSPGSFQLLVNQAMSKLRLVHPSPKLSEFEYWSQAPATELVFSDELNTTVGSVTTGWIMNRTSTLPAQCSGFVSNRYRNYSKRLTLDPDGNLRYYAKAPGSERWLVLWRALYDSCYVYDYCGRNGLCNFDVHPVPECPLPDEPSYCSCPEGYTKTGETQLGCQPVEELRCSGKSSFTRIENSGFDVSNPMGRQIVASEESCQETCSKTANCSCNAALYVRSSSECWLISSLVNGNLSSSQDNLLLFVRDSQSSQSDSGGLSTGGKIGVGVACVGGLFLLLLAGLFLRKTYKHWKTIKDGVLDSGTEYGLKNYSYEYLKLITDGFKRVIGQGGFGIVYLGEPPHGAEKLAVKVFKVTSNNDLETDNRTFLAEVESLASMRHANVVRLVGYCLGGAERALVYEYVENGSLDKHLFQKTTDVTKFQTRIDILTGAAKGIEYFHNYSGRKVVHRDIKPANILLDENFGAKVADFGTAKIVQAAFASTTFSLAGTLTYKAPECTMIGASVSVKADVFSFGVMCIEVVTGRKLVFTEGQRESMSGTRTMLFREAVSRMREQCWEDVVDERLEGEVDHGEDVKKVMRIAGWCLQENAAERPSMEMVVMMLKGEKMVEQPHLLGLPFYVLDVHVEDDSIAKLHTGRSSIIISDWEHNCESNSF